MKTSSCKAKSRRLQDFVVEKLYDTFKDLEDGDIKSAIMGETGMDIKLSPKGKKIIPFGIECKNQEKLNIWSSMEQCEKNTKDLTPLLIFKRNRSKVYVCLEFDDFINIIKIKKDE